MLQALEVSFGDPDKRNTAQTKIASLKQGNRPFFDYLLDFNTYASDTGLDLNSQKHWFEKGLCRELKTLLITTDFDSLSLNDAIKKCSLYDQRIRAIPPTPVRNTFTPRLSSVPAPPNTPAPQHSHQDHSHHDHSHDHGDPMDLSAVNVRTSRPRGPLTQAEREERRRLHLCLYCASPDHMVRDCPHKPRSSLRAVSFNFASAQGSGSTSAPASPNTAAPPVSNSEKA